MEVNQRIDTPYTREVAAEDAISAALPFKTLITGFWPKPKAFSVGETSLYRFHNLTITTKPVFFTTKSLKITTKCSIFTTKHVKITTKSISSSAVQ